jgi:myo-inositol catabolism protein IolS
MFESDAPMYREDRTMLARFGLGCWPLGGDQWGSQDDEQSIAAIHHALDRSITHFDTAQVYGRGHGEDLLGRTLPAQRKNLFIATKLLFTVKERVETALSFSLKRLKCESIDLVYIHWPKRGADLAGMMEGLECARAKGIIRYIGVSNFSVDAMCEVMRAGHIDACQIGYNALWRKVEREIVPFCRKNNIEIISYGSLAEGILTGKFGVLPVFPVGDHRKNTVLFDQMVWPHVHKAVVEMKTIAAEAGVTLPTCALQWLLEKGKVNAVLVGARNPEQVDQNLAAATSEVQEQLLDAITAISNRLQDKLPDEGNVFKWYP